MFDYVSSLCGRHEVAWDCATGNGQAAVELARRFRQVVATDASATQIASAPPHDSIAYRVAPAEDSGLRAKSADLLTVGQALHWFDQDAFADEARRVLVDGGVLAAWCYALCRVDDRCDAVVDSLYSGVLDDYWAPERRHVERGYRDIRLPGTPVDAPCFEMRLDWRVDGMLGYLRSWSASQRYLRARGEDPVAGIEPALRAAWGNAERRVCWPLTMRVCRL